MGSTRSGHGLSATSLGVLGGTGAGWMLLSMLARNPAVIAATAIWLMFHIALCAEVLRVVPAWSARFRGSTVLSAAAVALAA